MRSRSASPGGKCSPSRASSSGDAKEVKVTAQRRRAGPIEFTVRVRIDTPKEREYFRHGGILQYVLRQLASAGSAA